MKRIVIAVLGIAALVVGYFMFVQKGNNTENATAQPDEQSIEESRQAMRVDRGHTSALWLSEQVVENPTPTNWLALMRSDESPRLTAEQAEAYVTANKRSAESLLAAYRTTRDRAYLREALEKFPNDPKVNFDGCIDALFYSKDDYTTEERRTLLTRFEKTAPGNSLANYLAASDHFKSGESDKALEQFRNAATKSSLNDYSIEFIQNAEEAFRNAGYSEADAKGIAFWNLPLPHLQQLRQAGVDLLELAGRFQQSGDEAQAREARQLALHLADMLQDGSQQKLFMNQLYGIAIERKVLESLDPNSAYDNSGRTVQQRIDELLQNKKNLSANVRPADNLLPVMTPADQAAYFDRIRIHGEVAAAKWAVDKYGN